MQIAPIALRGRRVVLEPLTAANATELKAAALTAPQIFRYIPIPMQSAPALDRVLALSQALMQRGEIVAFVTRDAETGVALGSTSYLAIDGPHRRLEIGATWLLPAYQGTGHNTEAKYLQLRHAFEVAEAVRVELKTDARNARSRAAIRSIGGVEEGTLRCHMICPDGFVRNSVCFSIIRDEWPDVRRRLEAKLARTA